MSKLLLSGISLCLGFVLVGCGTAAPAGGGGGNGSIAGTWRVAKTFVENNETVEEAWTIAAANGQLTISSAGGTTGGTATADGAVFHWEGSDQTISALGVNNVLLIDIDCHTSVDGGMYGTEVFTRYVANGLGVLDPTPSTESWTFRATRE